MALTKVQSEMAGAGQVLQVVNATYATEVSSSTNSWIDTGLTATITPKFATSKILVIVNQAGCLKTASNTYLQVMLLRDSTEIFQLCSYGGSNSATTENSFGNVGGSYFDSPSTTSAVTYKTKFRSGANSSNVRVNFQLSVQPSVSSITLMEIAV